MVLDKLSTSLKNTLQKIAGSIFVDDKLINELIEINRNMICDLINGGIKN